MNVERRAGARLRGWLGSAIVVGAVLACTQSLAAEADKKAAAADKKAILLEADKKSEVSSAELQQKLDAAHKRLNEAAREVAELSRSMSDQAMVPYARAMAAQVRQRAILGINIGGSKASERDDGVEVLSVSPGGPAKAAGIKGGDVLLQIGGKSLKREEGTTGREKLLATLRDTKPGDKVVLNYRRDGKVATATVTTKPQDWAFTMGVPAPGAIPHIEGLRHFSFSRADGVFGSAELAPLTPKLGQYFGAEKGLLVVRAPNDARLQLEDGDVIVDIDGRVPSSPSHALRILGSYQGGEKLKLTVLRMKKRMTFDITIPEGAWEKSVEPRAYHFDYFTPAPVAVPAPGVRVPPPAPAPPAVEIQRDGPV